jgi:hypothetical protein
LSEAFPLFVLASRFPPSRARELGAYLRELMADLGISEISEHLGRVVYGVGVEQAPVLELLTKPGERRAPLSPRPCTKDREERWNVSDTFDGDPIRAARAETSEKRRVRRHLGGRPDRRVTRRLGVDTLRSDSLDFPCGEQAHQNTRDLAIVAVGGAPELFAKVRILVSGKAFAKAALECIPIGFRIV